MNNRQKNLTERVEQLEEDFSNLKQKFQDQEQYVDETLGEYEDRITVLEPCIADPSYTMLPEEAENQLVYGFSDPEANSYFWQWFLGCLVFVFLIGAAILLFQNGDHVGHLYFRMR